MPIDLPQTVSELIKPIMDNLNQCAFPSNVPINIGTYHAECFTFGMVVMIIAIIVVILNWEGLK